MAHRLGILVLAALWLFAPAVGATDGKTILYGGGGQGRVTFDGQLHAAKGYVCNDCHLQLFPTWKKGLITFADHKTPALCFACHNGEVAFKTCSGCHRDVPEPAAAAPALPPPTLSYEGATTIGSKILPQAVPLFRQRTGLAFGDIGGAGAGAGFRAVVEGRSLIGGLASEPTAEQRSQLGAMEVIGYDVMGVFVNDANPVRQLSRDALKGIFAGRVTNWKEVGGPDRAIVVCSESLNGGRATVKAFQEMVLDGQAYGPLRERDDATDCIADVAADPGGIAAASLSFAAKGVTALSIDRVPPTRPNVQSGAYPLKRPLTLIARDRSGPVGAFFDFMVTPEAQAIVGKTFVPVAGPKS